jgi:hypothetical protein
MRCISTKELAFISGGGDLNGCKSDIASGAGIGAVVGTGIGVGIGALVGTVAGPGGVGMGAAYGAAIGGETGALVGGAMAGANSPACEPTPQAPESESLSPSYYGWGPYSGGWADSFCDSGGISSLGCNYGMGDW